MTGLSPRVVVVTRPSEYELLLARHATHAQAKFFLDGRGQSIDELEASHRLFQAALADVMRALPLSWRRTLLSRKELDRFLFEPEDTLVAVGRDGLVANVAKYLDGQPVLGVNPDPKSYDGVLVPLAPAAVGELIHAAAERRAATRSLTMVEAGLDDGQTLLALNEVFVGHASHQSARYRLRLAQNSERQSSSGIVITTGTGATGWARSITRERKQSVRLPEATERRLSFFVREAFPSVATGVALTEGDIESGRALEVTSEMNEGGVVFGDGVEEDRLVFDWGKQLSVCVAKRTLELVTA